MQRAVQGRTTNGPPPFHISAIESAYARVLMLDLLVGFGPVLVGVLFLVASNFTRSVHDPRWWTRRVVTSVVLTLVLSVPLIVVAARNTDPVDPVPVRDTVEYLVGTCATPAAVGLSIYALRREGIGPWFRTAMAIGVALACLFLTLLVQLIVHCTSGDCL